MKIVFHKDFEKDYVKLTGNLKKWVKERMVIFVADPYDPILNNHALKGKYQGYRSLNVTGDVRVIYKLLDFDTALFVKIGSHSQLYN